LIVLIQELIQIHSCGALTRYKKKIQISTKEQVLKVQQNNPLTSYKPEKINNERVSLTTKWVDIVQYTHTHTQGNTTMRNIYTIMALGSYKKVSQIGHNKNIIR